MRAVVHGHHVHGSTALSGGRSGTYRPVCLAPRTRREAAVVAVQVVPWPGGGGARVDMHAHDDESLQVGPERTSGARDGAAGWSRRRSKPSRDRRRTVPKTPVGTVLGTTEQPRSAARHAQQLPGRHRVQQDACGVDERRSGAETHSPRPLCVAAQHFQHDVRFLRAGGWG
ncbi:hypothetical protein BS78_06G234400 [Paspalum vaginatum]|nr:hypothetical protein BS78_06G234400 [Paspalum vaginatum]